MIGDPHLRVGHLEQAKLLLEWIEQLVLTHQPARIINLGDTLHTHAVVRTEVFDLLSSHIIRLLSKWSGEYVLLVGNHDMVSNKIDVHPFRPLKLAGKRLKVVDKPTVLGTDLFLPYIHDPASWQRSFDEHCDQVKRVFCHQTFLGARMGQFYADDGVSVPDWDGQIVSGHVHTQQTLGCVWYPGTPYAQDANDVGEVKGVHVIDGASREFFESPLPKWVSIEVSVEDCLERIHHLASTDTNRVCLSGSSQEIAALTASSEFKKLKAAIGFSLTRRVASEKSSRAIQATTVGTGISEYIDKIYSGAVPRDALKRACEEVMNG